MRIFGTPIRSVSRSLVNGDYIHQWVARATQQAQAMALLWVLNFSDGDHSLLDIAETANLPFDTIWTAARRLEEKGLLIRRPFGSLN